MVSSLSAVRIKSGNNAAIILLIPADGIEQEPAITGNAIMEGFTADDIVWHRI